jgi:CRP/FNR family transcriptional regulator
VVCVLLKGYVKIELNGKQGRPLILKIAGRGAILGYRINSKHTYYSFSATAASDVQYCYIPNESFNVILQKCPDLKLQIINQLLDDLEIAEKKAIYLAHKTVREKIAEALLLLAEAYQYEIKRQSFKINLCRQDIADLAGTTKEQVSKTLKEFEKEKLIKCSAKKFSYINIQLLKEVVGNTYAPLHIIKGLFFKKIRNRIYLNIYRFANEFQSFIASSFMSETYCCSKTFYYGKRSAT